MTTTTTATTSGETASDRLRSMLPGSIYCKEDIATVLEAHDDLARNLDEHRAALRQLSSEVAVLECVVAEERTRRKAAEAEDGRLRAALADAERRASSAAQTARVRKRVMHRIRKIVGAKQGDSLVGAVAALVDAPPAAAQKTSDGAPNVGDDNERDAGSPVAKSSAAGRDDALRTSRGAEGPESPALLADASPAAAAVAARVKVRTYYEVRDSSGGLWGRHDERRAAVECRREYAHAVDSLRLVKVTRYRPAKDGGQ